jgi:phosphoglycerol transferase
MNAIVDETEIYSRKKSNVWLEYLMLNILVLMSLILILHLWNAKLTTYPLTYGTDYSISGNNENDSMQVLFYFQEMLDEGIFGNESRIGTPYTTESLDFSTGSYLFRILRTIVIKIFNNLVFAVNFIYLLGYFLAANITYYILKKLHFSRETAFVGAILYAFVPYHFFRGIAHTGYSSYWPVPLFLYYCIIYMKGERGYERIENNRFSWENMIHITALFLMAGKGVYFAYFSCFFLCAIVLYKLLQREEWILIKEVCFDLLLSLFFFSINCIPLIISRFKYGANSNIAIRSAGEVEYYGLKIADLLLPINDHRIKWLNGIKSKYMSFPLTNENVYAALGIFMGIGLLWLFIALIKKKNVDEIVYACAVLNVFALGLACVGGFSSLIGLFFSKIRCYNRISIYIAFFALIAALTLLERLKDKIKLKSLKIIVLICVLGGGVFDQTSDAFIPSYKEIEENWNSDKIFINQIEEMEDDGSMIYQMPYMIYPENGPVNRMKDYSHFIGLIHSKSLKWSYGCYTGRKGDTWNKNLLKLQLQDQIKQLKILGFAGVYIDSYAYNENVESVLEQLYSIIGAEPMISNNGRLFYYTLRNYSPYLNESDILKAKVFCGFENGFYSEESDGNDTWRWCKKRGDIVFYNEANCDLSVKIKMSVESILKDDNYRINCLKDEQVVSYPLNPNADNQLEMLVSLKPGENIINVTSNIPSVQLNSDSRKLSFNISNFEYEIMK